MPIAAILLVLFIGAILIPQVQQRIESVVSGFGSSVASGPVSTAVKAWIIVAGVAAGLGLGIWLLEAKIGKKEGYDVAPPPVESIGVATPPTFGATGGFTASTKEGLGISQQVSAEPGGRAGGAGVGQVTRIQQAKPRKGFGR